MYASSEMPERYSFVHGGEWELNKVPVIRECAVIRAYAPIRSNMVIE